MIRNVIAILITFTLGGGGHLNGQILRSVGFTGGVSLANQSIRYVPIDYTADTKMNLGITAAVSLEVFEHEYLSLLVNISYAEKGSRSSIQSVTVNHLDNDNLVINEGDTYTLDHSYLSVSPFLRVRFEKGPVGLYALVGPRIDILLNYESDSDYPLDTQNETIYGVNLGAGVEYSLYRLGLFAETIYQHDITSITNVDPLKIKNRSVSMAVGIRFYF